jgi:hypothetical protein
MRLIKLIFIVSFLLISSSWSYELDDNFLFCKDSQVSLNLEYDCKENIQGDGLISKLNLIRCEAKLNVLKIYIRFQDNFFKLENQVYHALNGKIFLAKCSNVKKIFVYEELESCTKDLPVSFLLNYENTFGYLTNDRIIKERSSIVPCDNSKKYLAISNKMLMKYQNKIELQPKTQELNLHETNYKTMVDHFDDYIGTNPLFRMIQDTAVSVYILICIVCMFIRSKFYAFVRIFSCFKKRYFQLSTSYLTI